MKVFGDFNTKRTFYVTPINQADKKKFGHPTIKPLEIVHNLVVNSSKEGEVVLDPFLGSGTTAVAAAKTNRHYIGFEIDEQYFDIACSRLDGTEQEKRGGHKGSDFVQGDV